mgnify:FL=1|tara:strand:- start:10161 stop:10946 length:786 start_codon:yes stop_codon:yes gene_type:complete
MVYKKGDKIAFLNESLHGVVIDCIGNSQVLVECKGIQMAVSVNEIIRITHIPKVEGKHIFPVKKADRGIDEFPNLDRNASDYNKLKVGDLVNFMDDNSNGKVVSILPENNYEIEIEAGFTIPANRLEIEKIWVQDIKVDDKQFKRQKKIDENKNSNRVSKSHQAPSNFFHDHEIDLHIENLTESWKGLSNFQIVSIQLSSFRKRFNQALINNESFLVVIHGVGKCVLREEIYNYLRQFPGVEVGPADAKIYGMGASEIRFK